MTFKEINIGQMIEKAVTESGIEMSRICNFFKCKEKEVTEMYQAKSLDTEILLKWSKLLEYDFFRIYTQHLILYAPPVKQEENENNKKSSLPQFRKNIYTKEIIDFILEQISNGKMTKNEVIERYRIPKTTLYKWISKYSEIK
ncbi:transposase [Empedobacter sp. GD03797]|uniref:transposase n=1 Tax=Empedobacter sp. GD03797 TaxID=2975382 RepID=UPI00244D3B66|nr:transposase [Empedobacter sp. GD03797]MDH1881831.1 transposase [Empedobacter sp. GD03797]